MARRNRKADIRALLARAKHLTIVEDATSITVTDPARPGWSTGFAKNSVLDGDIDDEKFAGIAAQLRKPPSPRSIR